MKCKNCGEVNPKVCILCMRCGHRLRPSSDNLDSLAGRCEDCGKKVRVLRDGQCALCHAAHPKTPNAANQARSEAAERGGDWTIKCRHGVCRMSEHCGEGKCGWFEPDETRISSVQSTSLLAAADALADACDKHAEAAACSVDHADWCETMEALEAAARAYRALRAANVKGDRT